jgi:hypothetical protein
MAEMFITRADDGLGDARSPAFPVSRIIRILDRILAIPGAALPVGAESARNVLSMLNDRQPRHILQPLVASDVASYLEEMVAVVFDHRGRITVRYVGDLKPTEYTTDVEFFAVATGVEQGEFSKLLREAVLSGGGKRTLINLSNVRDIVIDVGHADARNMGAEVSWLSAVADTFKAWGDISLIGVMKES